MNKPRNNVRTRLAKQMCFQSFTKSRFASISALRHIQPVITTEDANMFACSVVGSRLDNAILLYRTTIPPSFALIIVVIVFPLSSLQLLNPAYSVHLRPSTVFNNQRRSLSLIVDSSARRSRTSRPTRCYVPSSTFDNVHSFN